MSTVPASHRPVIGLGMTSLVVGTIGLMLCIFPVLGLPLSALGVLFGILGTCRALPAGGVRLRWSLAGAALSAAALAVNLATTYAPAGYWTGRDAPPIWREAPERPHVSPPG